MKCVAAPIGTSPAFALWGPPLWSAMLLLALGGCVAHSGPAARDVAHIPPAHRFSMEEISQRAGGYQGGWLRLMHTLVLDGITFKACLEAQIVGEGGPSVLAYEGTWRPTSTGLVVTLGTRTHTDGRTLTFNLEGDELTLVSGILPGAQTPTKLPLRRFGPVGSERK